MNGQPDKEKVANTVYNASLPFLKRDECERVKGQLSSIAKDMKEDRQQNRPWIPNVKYGAKIFLQDIFASRI